MLFVPRPDSPPLFFGADKVVHLVLFALLAGTTRWRFAALPAALAVVAAYAPISELVQGTLLRSRSGDPLDVLADLLGVALGWWSAARLMSDDPQKV